VRPRNATPRDPSRPTDGAAGAFVAHLHRRPWTAYQRAAADLIGERLPNGRYAYGVAVILFPRQVGKTTFAFDLAMGRCLDQVDYRAAYTAQTGHVTTERFGERMAELAGTALGRRVTARRSQGTERMTFGRGSYLKAFPPKDGALRGSALDLVIIDEPQEVDEAQGAALDSTILPVFTTRPRRQLILIGTAGDDRSVYLARYLAMARAGASGVALIEYGAADDDDPEDPAVWHRVHPGLVAGLTDDDAMRSALAVMGPAAFAREFLCVWQASGARVIPAAAWSAIRHRDATPDAGTSPVIAFDVAIDRSAAAVVACWRCGGVPVLEVIEYAPGTGWVAPLVKAIAAADRPPVIMADSAGPVLSVVDELTTAGVTVTTTSTRDYTAACAATLDAVNDGTVWHRGDPALEVAAAGANRRIIGEAWGWGRRTSTADVCPMTAGSLALWADRHRPAAPVRPVVTAG
jgi:hypothetical protein